MNPQALTDVDEVDVRMLIRPRSVPRHAVVQAVREQLSVRVRLHFQVGEGWPSDRHRWDTIARARNLAKFRTQAKWVMFVDDDVLLASDCISELLRELKEDEGLAAIAADYSHDEALIGRAGHVAMGATLFRGDDLRKLEFRATEKLCECWCACLDLRARGRQIRYSQRAKATHLRDSCSKLELTSKPNAPTPREGRFAPRIYAAFDRRDIAKFEKPFLQSLRNHGNHEEVVAVAYGLYPSERSKLMRIPGVTWHFENYNGQMTPVRRVADFAKLLADCDDQLPVAYWDVADVVFQDSLRELWNEVRATPDRLLAVAEPKGYPQNQVIRPWCLSICDPSHRHRALELLMKNPFLNSGFAAGSASIMRHYFQFAVAARNGPQLSGTTDWGDQMCLNLFCHSQPERWRRIDQRWNYCVHDRPVGEVVVRPDGRIVSRSGHAISVAHGNARSLRQFAMATTI